jgi:CubicO group peptidase (beta-lactamase class C family)
MNRKFRLALTAAALTAGLGVQADTIAKHPTAAEMGLMQGMPPVADKQVNWLNWIAFPYSRWAFQHTREIMPSKSLAPDVSTKPLQVALQQKAVAAITYSNEAGREESIAQMLDRTYTDAFLVMHKGRIVFEHYDNGMAMDKPHIVFSVTKSFTGLLLDSLVHEGLVDPTKTPVHYVPALKGSVYDSVTVQQVRDMLINADYSEVYDDPKSSIFEYSQALGFAPASNMTQLEFLSAVQGSKSHGDKFLYKSIHTDILAWIARRVTGQSIRDLWQERIWNPIGMRFPAYIIVNAHGSEATSAGLNITARDLARVGLTMLNDGEYQGRRVFAPEVVAAIRSGGDREAFKAGGAADSRPDYSYKHQWWVRHNEHGAYAALGVFGQRLYVDPAAEVVIVKMSSRPQGKDVVMDKDFDASMHAIGAHFRKH